MAFRGLASLICAAVLAACATSPASGPESAGAAPEQRLVRPANQPPPDYSPATPAAAAALDPGEAALAESPDAIPPEDDDAIVVPGRRQIDELPPGLEDPRSPQQRASDIRAWDRCVSQAQRRIEEPTGLANPVSDTPEAMCSDRLGMASRNAVPERRFQRR